MTHLSPRRTACAICEWQLGNKISRQHKVEQANLDGPGYVIHHSKGIFNRFPTVYDTSESVKIWTYYKRSCGNKNEEREGGRDKANVDGLRYVIHHLKEIFNRFPTVYNTCGSAEIWVCYEETCGNKNEEREGGGRWEIWTDSDELYIVQSGFWRAFEWCIIHPSLWRFEFHRDEHVRTRIDKARNNEIQQM